MMLGYNNWQEWAIDTLYAAGAGLVLVATVSAARGDNAALAAVIGFVSGAIHTLVYGRIILATPPKEPPQ